MTQPTVSVRFLTGFATFLLIASVAFVVLLLAAPIAGFSLFGDDVAVHTEIATEQLPDMAGAEIATDVVDVTVRVEDPTDEAHRWAAARDLLPALLVIAATWLLLGLLRSVRDGDPFIPRNVKRLRALGVIVLVGVPVATFARALFESALATSVDLPSRGADVSIPGNAILGGLAIFVLAEVFAAGVRLRDDLEGTV
jgi:hypothetical protein